MNREQLLTSYQFVALILAFYAANTWISSQGASPVLDIRLLDERRAPGALLALVLCSPLLVVLARIARLYAQRFGRGDRWRAVPPMGLGILDTRLREARCYLRAQILVFMLVPALSLLHFGNIVLNADICVRADKSEAITVDRRGIGHLDFPNYEALLNDGYRLDGWEGDSVDGSKGPGCRSGITYFPVLQPIFLLLWAGWALLETIRYLVLLYNYRAEPIEEWKGDSDLPVGSA